MMRRLIMAALAGSVTIAPIAAMAQDNPYHARKEYRDEVRDANQDYRKDLRHADNWRDVQRAKRERNREIRDARKDYRKDTRDWRRYRSYDWNRAEPGQRYYYADRYYRDGRYYRPYRLSRNDRVYRGNDGRYYCRRSDGTTGLIAGAALGGLLGNALSSGRSATFGTLLGVAGGAALGSSIDRGRVVCR
jgi:uncharacterized protein YcfJ